MINTDKRSSLLASLFAGAVLVLGGCNSFEGAGIDEGAQSAESLRILEAEVFELYSLAPCTASHGYCSSSFLIEDVDALIAGYCLEGLSEEALRIYTLFEHFENPSPRPPEC